MAEKDDVIKAIGQKLLMPTGEVRRMFELDPFTFQIQFLPVAASATESLNFLVQADSAFAIVKTMVTVADTADAFVANLSDTPKYQPFLVTLTDSGSGRDLSDGGISLENWFGTAQRPYIWPKIKLLDPNSTFAARIQNLVATARNVRMAFGGFKVFGNVAAFKRTKG